MFLCGDYSRRASRRIWFVNQDSELEAGRGLIQHGLGYEPEPKGLSSPRLG